MSGFSDMSSSGVELLEQSMSQLDREENESLTLTLQEETPRRRMLRSHTRQGSSPAVTPPPPPTQLPRSIGAARGTGTGGGAVTPGVSAGAGAGATGGPIRRGGGIGRGKARVRRGALTSHSSSSINRPCSYPYRRSSTPHLQPPPQPPLADKPTLLVCLHFLHEIISIKKPLHVYYTSFRY